MGEFMIVIMMMMMMMMMMTTKIDVPIEHSHSFFCVLWWILVVGRLFCPTQRKTEENRKFLQVA